MAAKKGESKDIYFEAASAAEIAKELIPKYHPHLEGVPILYLFNDGKMKEWAKISSRSRKERFISGYYFVMEISHKVWATLTEEQRNALVDHELSHAWIDKNGEPEILDHDVEEFSAIIKRHGFWRDNVKQFGFVCFDQMQLPLSKTG